MRHRILVADDDLDNRAIAAAVLGAAGFEVLQAKDGEEAIARALADRPDLVLLDMDMPGVTGWEAAGRIKAAQGPAAVPIVAYTAHALKGAEEKARAAGCDGYLAKPCAPRMIVETVRRFLCEVGI